MRELLIIISIVSIIVNIHLYSTYEILEKRYYNDLNKAVNEIRQCKQDLEDMKQKTGYYEIKKLEQEWERFVGGKSYGKDYV